MIETSLIKAELFGAGENSYLVAGAVDVAELDRLAGELVAGTARETRRDALDAPTPVREQR